MNKVNEKAELRKENKLSFCMAPMDQITTFVYRNAFRRFYGGVDTYYTPFISPAKDADIFQEKEFTEIDRANNRGIRVIPQLMVNDARLTLRGISILRDMGYDEVNLNLGCPSGVVVRKGKGAAMLKDTDKLDHFFDSLFTLIPSDMRVSIKSRAGFADDGEVYHLLEVYNKYPIKELILHPRTRGQFYKGELSMKSFDHAYNHSRAPLCFNGEVNSLSDICGLKEKYPDLTGIMLGRGLIKNPGLLSDYLSDKNESSFPSDMDRFLAFHDALLEGYKELLPEEYSVVVKMKKLWAYWQEVFLVDQELMLKILQTRSLDTYRELTHRIWEDNVK